ncbi:MAG TPA: cupin domain-containing protein [Allosphingosinicella sp.]|jgi:hypothetical protein|nr:cupin domain-containing protein [Allosphingosinicella sp.]
MSWRAEPVFEAAYGVVDALLAPLSLRDLVTRHWGRTAYVGTGRNRRFEGLPGQADVEYLMASLASPKSGWFSMVKERARPPDDSFLTFEGWLDLAEVYKAYDDGHSLLLNQAQKRHPATGRLCRQIEIALTGAGILLTRHIGANLYLSPPKSQGFSIHYDPHDVLILQLEGTKHWRVYERRFPVPVEPPSAPFTAAEAGPVGQEFEVGPGDLLYLPRGVLHEARTSASSSLHLTLSIEQATWRDLFAIILAEDPALRESVPIGFAVEGLTGAEGLVAVKAKANALALSDSLGPAIAALRARLLSRSDRLPAAGPPLGAAVEIDGGTWLRLADGIYGDVQGSASGVTLGLPGSTLSAGPEMLGAFRMLLTEPRFRPADLPIGAPLEEKLAFVKSLVLDGFLVRAGDEAEAR